jgi:hypothetical protein
MTTSNEKYIRASKQRIENKIDEISDLIDERVDQSLSDLDTEDALNVIRQIIDKAQSIEKEVDFQDHLEWFESRFKEGSNQNPTEDTSEEETASEAKDKALEGDEDYDVERESRKNQNPSIEDLRKDKTEELANKWDLDPGDKYYIFIKKKMSGASKDQLDKYFHMIDKMLRKKLSGGTEGIDKVYDGDGRKGSSENKNPKKDEASKDFDEVFGSMYE